MAKLLRVGSQTFDLGPPLIIEGLFATIRYRLEPGGRGTRYPIVMNRLYGGRMAPLDADATSKELHEIDTGLAHLAPDRVVWSISDLRRRDDSGFAVNHAAGTARDYFIAGDGRPLPPLILEAVQLSRDRNEPLVLSSSEAAVKSRTYLFLLVTGFLGLCWAICFSGIGFWRQSDLIHWRDR